MAIPNQQGGNHAWERERGTGYTQENNISQRLQHIHPHHNSFLHSPSLSNPPVRQYFKVTDKNRREWLWAHWTESCRPCPRTSTPSPPPTPPATCCEDPTPSRSVISQNPAVGQFGIVRSILLFRGFLKLMLHLCCNSSSVCSLRHSFLPVCVHHVLSFTVLTARKT